MLGTASCQHSGVTNPAEHDRPARTYGGADQEQRVAGRRARLVEAGVEVFGTSGYRTATVERICAQAGLTKRYLYESFDDTEALLLACYERLTAEINTAMVAAVMPVRGGMADQLQAALTGYFGAIEADPRAARITLFEILGVSAAIDRAYRDATEDFANAVRFLAQSAFAASGLPESQQHTIAQGVIGAITTIAAQWVLNERAEPRAQIVAATHILVLAILDRLQAGA